ncbi:MAG TPA: hypothetical protein VFW02_00270 [Candidatus Limnocylindrales bacterium]|nr:hypothetical protein [Candidatus Limnocylindrales bacterium]
MTTAPGRSLGLPGRLVLLVAIALGLAMAASNPFAVFFFVPYAVLGALLVARRPRHVIGWLLVLIAFGFVGVTTDPTPDPAALRADLEPLTTFLWIWIGAWSPYVTFGGYVALTVLFPSGRAPEGRWHVVSLALLAGSLALAVLAATAPTVGYNPDSGVATIVVENRLAVFPDLWAWALIPVDAFILPMVVFLVVGVASMLVRYRRSTGIERLQLRWLVASLTFVVLAVVGGLLLGTVIPAIGGGAWIFTMIAFPTVPIAIYVAVTRYRLYEIDRIISRTIGWVVVTVLLAAVFAGAIIALQAALAPVTENNTLAVAASTLLAASLFQPLRARVQRAVDRRFNRGRVDAQRVTDAFAAHVRDSVDLAVLRDRLVAAVEGTVEPAGTGLWLRRAGR